MTIVSVVFQGSSTTSSLSLLLPTGITMTRHKMHDSSICSFKAVKKFTFSGYLSLSLSQIGNCQVVSVGVYTIFIDDIPKTHKNIRYKVRLVHRIDYIGLTWWLICTGRPREYFKVIKEFWIQLDGINKRINSNIYGILYFKVNLMGSSEKRREI